MLWFLFIPGKPYLFLLALPFFSFGIGGLFTLMMSMTADVIDLDELNTGKRREGVFGAIYWWMVKFGFGIAGGLSGVILSVIGWESGGATQTEEALYGLRLFFSGLPILGTITKKCEVEKIANKKFKIVLTQGLNRQIRRMCEYLNYEVKQLKRVRIMNIKFDIREGEWRYFTKKELKEMHQILKKSNSMASTIISNLLLSRCSLYVYCIQLA
mgnify:CR=1 FL=1